MGSKQWIGAIELGFVLDTLLGVQCKVRRQPPGVLWAPGMDDKVAPAWHARGGGSQKGCAWSAQLLAEPGPQSCLLRNAMHSHPTARC